MTRDYFFVLDGVSAYLSLAEHLAKDRSLAGEAFNFSNESPQSVLQVVKQILVLMGREDLQPIVKNEASHEIPYQYLSASKARERLGWKPLYSFLEGLEKTIAWYKAFFNVERLR